MSNRPPNMPLLTALLALAILLLGAIPILNLWKDASEVELVVNAAGAFCLILAMVVLVALAGMILSILFRADPDKALAGFLLEKDPSDPAKPGKASLSRLQMLLWNFVVAFVFLYYVGVHDIHMATSELFTPEVLMLLGISNGTYFLSKAVRPGVMAGGMPQQPPETETQGEHR